MIAYTHSYTTENGCIALGGMMFSIIGLFMLVLGSQTASVVFGATFLISGVFAIYKVISPTVWEGIIDSDKIELKINNKIQHSIAKSDIHLISIHHGSETDSLYIHLNSGEDINISDSFTSLGPLTEVEEALNKFNYNIKAT